MPDPVTLNPDGPHSPGYTAKVGDQLAEAVRVLNHATMPGKGGLDTTAGAYKLIADLYTAMGRFPQVCRQIARFLQALQDADRLRDVRDRDTGHLVEQAEMRLTGAAIIAEQAAHSLQEAQGVIAGLMMLDGPDE